MKLLRRKSTWRSRMLELLGKNGGLTWSDLRKELGIPKSSLSRNLQKAINEGTIELGVNAENKPVYVLSRSEVQKRLRKSIALVLESVSLYPLETVATSYGTLSGEDHIVEASIMNTVNFILQKQHGHKISEILRQYRDTERLQLFKIFANVTLDGLR
jgi:DNA-binding MarR family transcriptional regulator